MSRAWTVTLLTGALSISLKALGPFLPTLSESARFAVFMRRITPFLLPGMLSALIVVQTFSDAHDLVIDARVVGLIATVLAIRFRSPVSLTLIVAAVTTAAARAIYHHLTGGVA